VPDLTKKQKIGAGAILVVILAVSFFRDHLFRSVNEQLRLNYYGEDLYDYSFLAPFLSRLSDENLLRLKFVMTAVFVALFAALCVIWIKNLFRNRNYLLYVGIAYGSVFILGILIYGAGKLTSQPETFYNISRNILEFVQSPLMILILTAIFWYDTRTNIPEKSDTL
jgi:hypothetical protein